VPLNLIADSWIPVLAKNGERRVIAPWQMADASLLRPDWPRADLNIACYELLIGLVFLADPPEDAEDWDARQAPDPDRLRARLAPLAEAFNLTGNSPLFLQDFDELEGEPNPPDMLFIDSAGANTAKNNADLMVRRGRYGALDLPLAAMALYGFQAHAPSGGAGNRTSMRGGGPMLTLVDPGAGLWPLVWANVPDGEPAEELKILPWMRQTIASVGDARVWSRQAHPAEAFFGQPRRLRLVAEGEWVTGVIQRPYGANYAGWVHPLSPYYRMKEGAELLPQHPRAGLFGYRHWLGVAAAMRDNAGLKQRAEMVDAWPARSNHAKANIIVAGWAMDNMKPRDFTWSLAPLIDLDGKPALLLSGMVEAAELFALSLRRALGPVLAEGEAREALREAFYAKTQSAFEARLAELTAGGPPEEVARRWLADMRKVALGLFESRALPGLDQRETDQQKAVVDAHRFLCADFAGKSKQGAQAWGMLELTPPVSEKKEKGVKA